MGHAANVSIYPWGPPDICPPGIILPLVDERLWSLTSRTVVYFALLIYFFLGIAILTSILLTAIEEITSTTKKVYVSKPEAIKSKRNGSSGSLESLDEEPEIVEVRIWNDTVVTLVLLGFGTAVPEIVLSIMEMYWHHFEPGVLSTSTIVGSCVFNLLVVTSICIMALPLPEAKRVHRIKVFSIIALFTLLAFLWLHIILSVITPDVIELWEALITTLLFPILILFAYATDAGWILATKHDERQHQVDLNSLESDDKLKIEGTLFKDGKLDRANLVRFVKEVKKHPGLTDEDAALLAASKLVNATSHDALWYQIGAVRKFTGAKRTEPVLNEKLKEVYKAMDKKDKGDKDNKQPEKIETNTDFKIETKNNHAIIEFHAVTVAVREDIGSFKIGIIRHGNLNNVARVRVESIDGSAKQGKRYHKVNQSVLFKEGDTEKFVTIRIIDDQKWDPTEEFFLRLTLLNKTADMVKLGGINIMEVTIIDDDDPGTIQFEKRGYLVKESSGVVAIPILRTSGSDGDVSVKWKTVDKTAMSPRDYQGGSGVVMFKHGEVRRVVEIPIIDDLKAEKDEYFEVKLSDPTGGAKIGSVKHCAVTITNDDAYNSVVDRLMLMTNTNLDAIAVHSETWGQQITSAMNVNGGDLSSATTSDYWLHLLTFFWKVLFALIPPPKIFHGWLTFFITLIVMGLIMTVTGDLARRFGCVIGLDDTVTGITLVALGTSLPEIVGASFAARGEKEADGCLSHILGRIAVTVLVGVGMPWLVAAVYHTYNDSVLQVKAVGLELSVLMYSIVAIIAFILLFLRRRLKYFGAGEIGGPKNGRYVSVGILLTAWVVYIVCTVLNTYGYIDLL
uniref:Sodium/calcium exchanger 3 n=1 Tax=Cacopsylla melanoneura TaxID=428564 RepID=A0A8D8M8W6_9HEMI